MCVLPFRIAPWGFPDRFWIEWRHGSSKRHRQFGLFLWLSELSVTISCPSSTEGWRGLIGSVCVLVCVCAPVLLLTPAEGQKHPAVKIECSMLFWLIFISRPYLIGNHTFSPSTYSCTPALQNPHIHLQRTPQTHTHTLHSHTESQGLTASVWPQIGCVCLFVCSVWLCVCY